MKFFAFAALIAVASGIRIAAPDTRPVVHKSFYEKYKEAER